MFGWKKATASEPAEKQLRCSFCNKTEDDVKKLIAGPTVFICDECIQVCNDIIADESRFEASTSQAPAESPSESELSSDRGPCLICGTLTLVDDALIVEERGIICLSCGEGVQSALAERKLAPRAVVLSSRLSERRRFHFHLFSYGDSQMVLVLQCT